MVPCAGWVAVAFVLGAILTLELHATWEARADRLAHDTQRDGCRA